MSMAMSVYIISRPKSKSIFNYAHKRTHTDRQTHRQTQTDRQTDTHTHTHTHTHTNTHTNTSAYEDVLYRKFEELIEDGGWFDEVKRGGRGGGRCLTCPFY